MVISIPVDGYSINVWGPYSHVFASTCLDASSRRGPFPRFRTAALSPLRQVLHGSCFPGWQAEYQLLLKGDSPCPKGRLLKTHQSSVLSPSTFSESFTSPSPLPSNASAACSNTARHYLDTVIPHQDTPVINFFTGFAFPPPPPITSFPSPYQPYFQLTKTPLQSTCSEVFICLSLPPSAPTHAASCSGQYTATVLAKLMWWMAVFLIIDRFKGGISPLPRLVFTDLPLPLPLPLPNLSQSPAMMRKSCDRRSPVGDDETKYDFLSFSLAVLSFGNFPAPTSFFADGKSLVYSVVPVTSLSKSDRVAFPTNVDLAGGGGN